MIAAKPLRAPPPEVRRRAYVERLYADIARDARPESDTSKRRRMADLITRRVSATGGVTRDDLASGGFSEAEISAHFRPALEATRLHRLGGDL